MNKIDIKNLSKEELKSRLKAMGFEPYRACQIFRWLYKSRVKSFDSMTDLPADLRKELKSHFHVLHLTLLDSRSSKVDETTKCLFKLEDANTIETVYLSESRRVTICLSSQVGCKFACSFCASAPFGFVRNLKSSEIIDEVLSIEHLYPDRPVSNLVFMGIGEPFDNYDNLLGAIRIFNDPDAFNIGARKITVSTCGIIPAIKRFSREGLQVELSISLHSADDDIRSRLVPINKKYPIKELVKTCRQYTEDTHRVITFEYILIKDVNSRPQDAHKLVKLLKGLKCKVNTISFNKIKAIAHDEPAQKDVREFISILKNNGINTTHRKSKGEDIDAGCGQLRISKF